MSFTSDEFQLTITYTEYIQIIPLVLKSANFTYGNNTIFIGNWWNKTDPRNIDSWTICSYLSNESFHNRLETWFLFSRVKNISLIRWSYPSLPSRRFQGSSVFRPSPQTPAQPKTTFLSHCFIRLVSGQSTVLKLSGDRLNTIHKLVVVLKRDLTVTVFLLFSSLAKVIQCTKLLLLWVWLLLEVIKLS